jgi:hypothetical protein
MPKWAEKVKAWEDGEIAVGIKAHATAAGRRRLWVAQRQSKIVGKLSGGVVASSWAETGRVGYFLKVRSASNHPAYTFFKRLLLTWRDWLNGGDQLHGAAWSRNLGCARLGKLEASLAGRVEDQIS